MTKAELVKQLSEQANCTKALAETMYDSLLGAVKAELKKGNSFQIPGVGTLSVVERKARKGRNPRTGQEIAIPPKKAVKFSASSKLEL